ncbi:NAD(P)/FAD-dependent oxidoreductase [Aquisalibacillus elongatus]|uniref:D-amino-acid dehydrogenase n=1 Tax=Aquisalibacillus elongatus TaxID=485577 RepID=A0A3N5B4D0_9BACI|nr:FAD-binding oxidoreductase [Aquisalibacillus elongatus]RPF52173.1 D-amino-acid dehydrogenase [Aquisalibacillus elongatus]
MKPYIIIGAGILGASTAYHLSKQGVPVILIDKHHKGEATRSGAGIISPWLSQKNNQKLYKIISSGAKYYPELVRELSDQGIHDTSYAQVGSIHLHKSQDKLEKMVQDAADRREDAPEVEGLSLLTGQEVNNSISIMGDRMGAVKVDGGARVNGRKMRDALIQAAKLHGTEVIEGEAQFISDNKISVNQKELTGQKIIVTNGAWADHLLKQIGISFHVSSQKTQILQLEYRDDDPSKWPAIMLPNNKYIVGFENHQVFVGSAHDANDDFDPTSSAAGVYEILKTAFKFAPGLEQAKFIGSQVGFRPTMPDQEPYIGNLPNHPDIFITNGLGASGITSGPYLGKTIAETLLNG